MLDPLMASTGSAAERVKRGTQGRLHGFDVALMNYLRMTWSFGKTGMLEVRRNEPDINVKLYFFQGTLCQMQIDNPGKAELPEDTVERLLSVLRWPAPELEWHDEKPCTKHELRIEAGDILRFAEDKALSRQASRWGRVTCQLYTKKMVPILPLDIVLTDPDGLTTTTRMELKEVLVGRAMDADISAACSSLSRHHVRIRFEKQTLYIRDAGSHNGTFLNGTRLTPEAEVPFSMHDKVMLANVRLEVRHAASMTVAAYKMMAEEHMRRLKRTVQRLPSGNLVSRAPGELEPTSKMPALDELEDEGQDG